MERTALLLDFGASFRFNLCLVFRGIPQPSRVGTILEGTIPRSFCIRASNLRKVHF
jgi:hypothetical protein